MNPNSIFLKVSKIIDECIDSKSIQFLIPDDSKDKFSYKPGQFIGITQNINNEVVHRSYSLSSNPNENTEFQVSVKKIPDGKMSTYLVDSLKEGDELLITPPAGRFTFKDNFDHSIFIGAGSGITPLFSMIKEAITLNNHKVSLIYSNKSPESTMFLNEFLQLEKMHPNFKVHWLFTQNKQGFTKPCTESRLNTNILKCLSSSNDCNTASYLCGPEPFMDLASNWCELNGIKVYKESFFTGQDNLNKVQKCTPTTATSNDETFEGTKAVGINGPSEAGFCEEIDVTYDDEKCKVTFQKDETILDSLLREGENPPYSCMSGTCLACQCKLVEGTVDIMEGCIFDEEDLEQGLILSCQAIPKSKKVIVDFDDI